MLKYKREFVPKRLGCKLNYKVETAVLALVRPVGDVCLWCALCLPIMHMFLFHDSPFPCWSYGVSWLHWLPE